MQADIDELQQVVKNLKSEANVARVQKLIDGLKAELAATSASNSSKETPESTESVPVVPAPTKRPAPVQDTSSKTAATNLGGNIVKYVPIDRFGWDQSNKFVSLYLSNGLEGVGEAEVESSFGEDWFDLKIHNLKGKNYRLRKNGLDKNIVPEKSKHKVSAKNNMVTIKLRKVDGKYGPDHWSELTPKFKKAKSNSSDPTAGIMDMMKQMYDEGDDKMKETIGKAMLEANKKKGMSM